MIFSLLLAFISRWKLFLTPGIVGHNWDWHIPYLKELNLQRLLALPYSWTELSFGYTIPLGIYQFPTYVFGFLFGGEIGSKLFIYCTSLFSLINAFTFLRYIIKKFINNPNNQSVVLGAFVYAFMPIVFNNLIGGQTNAFISYAFFPLFFYFYFKYFDNKSFTEHMFPLGFVFFLLCSSQVVFLAIGLSIVFFFLLYRKRLARFLVLISFFILVGNSLFFYLFSNMAEANEIIPEQLKNNASIQQSFVNHYETIDKVIVGTGYGNRNLFLNFMGEYRLVYFSISYLLLIMVMGKLLLKHEKVNNKKLLFAVLLTYLVGLFLATAGRQPFGEFFVLLMTYFTPMKMFRTFFIFFVLISFPFSIMTTISFSLYSKKFKHVSSFMLGLLLIANLPVFIEGDNGIRILKNLKKDSIDIYQIDPNYLDILNSQIADPSWYRVLYIPTTVSPTFLETPYQRAGQGGDPEVISNPKPIINDFSLTQEKKRIYNLIEGNLVDPRQPINQELLSFLSFRKIIRRKDVKTTFSTLKDEYSEELINKKLSSLDPELRSQFVNYYNLDDTNYLPHLYISQNSIYSPNMIEVLPKVLSLGSHKEGSAIYLAGEDNNYFSNEYLLENANEIFIEAYLKSKISDEELKSAGTPTEETLPYVRWKPDSLMAFLATKKEEYDKWKIRKNPEELFYKHIFYGGKRIAEIIKFTVNQEEERSKILNRYQNEMTKALEIIKKLKESKNEKYSTLLADFENTLRNHTTKINESGGLEKWKIVFAQLENEAKEQKVKRNFSELLYEIEIPEDGEYQIFIRNFPLEDGNEKIEAYEWKELEKKHFKKGNQQLSLPINGISENLISETSKINNYSSNSIYRITFDYEANGMGSFFINESSDEKTTEITLPPTNNELKHFEMFFRSSKTENDDASITTSSIQEKNLKVEMIYEPEVILKRVKMENQSIPSISFIRLNPTKYKARVEGAKNPYLLVFSESYQEGWKIYLNNRTTDNYEYNSIISSYFNDRVKEYSHKSSFLEKVNLDNWKKNLAINSQHLMINGYANSWYIKPEDVGGREDYEIIIEFLPQRPYSMGLVVSMIILASCLGLTIFSFIKKLVFFRNNN